MKTLTEILMSQDISESHATDLSKSAMNCMFDYQGDPISGIVVNAFMDAGLHEDSGNVDDFINNIDYAINQLKRARNSIA